MEELYLTIINNLCDGVYFVNLDRTITFWNKAAENITGYTAEEMIGKSCQLSRLSHIDETGQPLCITSCPLFATIVDGKQRRARVFVRHKNGHRLPIIVNIFPIKKDGEIIGAIEIFTQNSPVVYEDNLIENLSGIAMHDALTELPNRRYLESFLNYKFEDFKRFGKMFAILFADIDNFRVFNNNYGHETGDLILKNIAASIKNSMRRDDLVGRWGGEEMLGVYSIHNPNDIPLIGEKFRRLVANTEIHHKDSVLSVSVSVGITVIREDDTVNSVVERADKFMYQSKKDGKNRVNFEEDFKS